MKNTYTTRTGEIGLNVKVAQLGREENADAVVNAGYKPVRAEEISPTRVAVKVAQLGREENAATVVNAVYKPVRAEEISPTRVAVKVAQLGRAENFPL